MGEQTEISWAHATFNPWTRCTRISPACDHCYAATWAGRATHPKDANGKALPLWGDDAPRDPTSAHNWKQPVRWNRDAEAAGERRRVFCASLADVFEDHPAITKSGARIRLFGLIESTPHLDWMLLTKRPQNILGMMPAHWLASPRHNVWFGTTAENQQYADERIPHLLGVPAVVRFLSIEPMLGPIVLRAPALHAAPEAASTHPIANPEEPDDWKYWAARDRGIQWLITGGESGHSPRPTHPAWIQSLRDQCVKAGVAYHHKQWGEWAPIDRPWTLDSIRPLGPKERWMNRAGGHGFHGEDVYRMGLVGKKEAGRLLDGRVWNEFPAVHS